MHTVKKFHIKLQNSLREIVLLGWVAYNHKEYSHVNRKYGAQNEYSYE